MRMRSHFLPFIIPGRERGGERPRRIDEGSNPTNSGQSPATPRGRGLPSQRPRDPRVQIVARGKEPTNDSREVPL